MLSEELLHQTKYESKVNNIICVKVEPNKESGYATFLKNIDICYVYPGKSYRFLHSLIAIIMAKIIIVNTIVLFFKNMPVSEVP